MLILKKVIKKSKKKAVTSPDLEVHSLIIIKQTRTQSVMTSYRLTGHVFGVTIIFVRNGIDDPSSNPG